MIGSWRVLLLTLCVGACLTTNTPPPVDPPVTPGDAGVFVADDCRHASDEAISVTLGSGAGVYQELQSNDVMIWEKGPQGGHHIWIGVRMKGLHQAGTITAVSVTDLQNPATPVLLTNRRVPFTYDREEGGFCVLKNIRTQLDEDLDIATLQGHHLLIELTLTDRTGATATDERFVEVQGPVDNG